MKGTKLTAENISSSGPMVSIITVCKDSEHTIGNSLNSLFSQSYKNIEAIVQDGLSRDNTLEILSSYGSRLNVLSEADVGLYDALNRGIARASGEIVGILHSDDIYAESSYIESVVEVFKEQGCDLVYSDLSYASSFYPLKIIRNWDAGDFTPRSLDFGWMPPHPTVFIKAELLKRVGPYREDFRISGDYEFLLRLLSMEGLTIGYLRERGVLMKTGGESNGSLQKLVLSLKEDIRALTLNRRPRIAAILKRLRKLPQRIVL